MTDKTKVKIKHKGGGISFGTIKNLEIDGDDITVTLMNDEQITYRDTYLISYVETVPRNSIMTQIDSYMIRRKADGKEDPKDTHPVYLDLGDRPLSSLTANVKRDKDSH